MKKLLIAFIFYLPLAMQAQDYKNMKVLSHWNDTTLKKVDGDQIWNDCTGWHDSSNSREYFIAGSSDSIYFFDITDPTQMMLITVKAGLAKNAINRDYETYHHYLYTVNDQSTLGGLQIFDLQYLPDSVVEVFASDTFGSKTHTIFIDASSKRLYMCDVVLKPSGASAMEIFSLDNPVQPEFIGRYTPPDGGVRVHEMFARNDTVYLSCGYAGLYIYDMRDAANPVYISSIVSPYPQSGFNHSSWLDSTGKWLMFTDENQGLGIKLYDLSDIHNPSFRTVWNSHTGALPHNAYWKGGYAFVSSYEDGVYIYDLRNPETLLLPGTPDVIAYYDTYSLNGTSYHGFHGCWGLYPFLPSGNILASDISEGLFVLNTLYPLGEAEFESKIEARIYPNPVNDVLNINLRKPLNSAITAKIINMQGKLVAEKNFYLQPNQQYIQWNTEALSSGFYLLELSNEEAGRITLKLMK